MTPDLETRLRDLATVIEFPPTPDLATPVEQRLGASRAPRRRWGWRPILIAAAILLLVAAVATAAAVRWWSIPGAVTIQRVAELPPLPTDALTGTAPSAAETAAGTEGTDATAPSTGTGADPGSAPPGAGFALGELVASTEEAARQTGFPVPVPADPRLGEPDAVYVGNLNGNPMATLVWRPSADLPALARPDIGAMLTVFQGRSPRGELVGKMVGPDTTVEDVDVGDGPAYFVSGAPHFVVFEIGNEIQGEDVRLAANVLLWQQDGTVLRLEADVPRDVATDLARSVQ
jgi:hypothetical protein